MRRTIAAPPQRYRPASRLDDPFEAFQLKSDNFQPFHRAR
jgi:hypothetical protein